MSTFREHRFTCSIASLALTLVFAVVLFGNQFAPRIRTRAQICRVSRLLPCALLPNPFCFIKKPCVDVIRIRDLATHARARVRVVGFAAFWEPSARAQDGLGSIQFVCQKACVFHVARQEDHKWTLADKSVSPLPALCHTYKSQSVSCVLQSKATPCPFQ